MPESPFQWFVSRRVYIWKSNGRVVTPARLNQWVEKAMSGTSEEMRQVGLKLIAGEINRAEWAIESGEQIRNLHRSLGMLAAGGRNQMNARRWGQVGGVLQRELAYFNRFASYVDNQDIENLGERFLSRTQKYAQAGWATWQNAVRARETEHGGMLEQNLLGASTHSCSECIAQSELGFVPVGELVPIGERICGPNCNCFIEYKERNAASEEAA